MSSIFSLMSVPMPDFAVPTAATRVVLLARPGTACERLSAALQEAGAELVLVADPTTADQDAVADAAPEAILIALEPNIEDALERFGRVLSDPAITVIFDEAELAAQRAGWDAARWVRHLSAKLHRHYDVLPPGGEGDGDWHPSPGPLQNVVRMSSDLDLAAFADEAEQLAGELPRDAVLEAMHPQYDDALASYEPSADDAPASFAASDDAAPNYAATDDDDALPSFSVADGDATTNFAATEDATETGRDLGALDEAISGLTLVDPDSYGHGPRRGAVVVEAGLGGPDAVRQLLGELPADFPRAILVRLRLDGGRYERLVKQMERATELAVVLAEPGRVVERGYVYFMAPDITVVDERARLKFELGEGGAAALFGVLPPEDSAVLFLSGSERSVVEAALAPSWSGALVAAQSPESCYDGAASTDVIARGGASGSPAELAERLANRWPA